MLSCQRCTQDEQESDILEDLFMSIQSDCTKEKADKSTETAKYIHYNYTSASDLQIIKLIFGADKCDLFAKVQSSHILNLNRLIGAIFVFWRNPYVAHDVIYHKSKYREFVDTLSSDLELLLATINSIKDNKQNKAMMDIYNLSNTAVFELLDEIKFRQNLYITKRKFLTEIGGVDGYDINPFALVSHATDATDWRLFPPVLVWRPQTIKYVQNIVANCAKLGLKLIARGGGTGLTGGAIPLTRRIAILNTEKLNKIFPIETQSIENEIKVSKLRVQSGVITEDAMHFAQKHELIFATDPTSHWASTIGGNISENAGGKSAVLYGTAIDNLLAYKMVTADGDLLTISRLRHPFRKIQQHDQVVFKVSSTKSGSKEIILEAKQIRKPGLWKDITNKCLGGLPGLQKEGCDGVIVEAEFILYPNPSFESTVAVEFFGSNLQDATLFIQQVITTFESKQDIKISAMEHFDKEYIDAIVYKTKSTRSINPIAVLLIDFISEQAAFENIVKTSLFELSDKYKQIDLFFAANKEEREQFWSDRKKLGAIAARTNAFKINEDIVIPIKNLDQFATYCQDTNLKLNKFNLKNSVEVVDKFLQLPFDKEDEAKLVLRHKEKLVNYLSAIESLMLCDNPSLDESIFSFTNLTRQYWHSYPKFCEQIIEIFCKERKRLLLLATHMHAGDGNVHVNIPVFSNDSQMMLQADKVVDELMLKVQSLDGVPSGEHGIGVTKLKYLNQDNIDALIAYLDISDPTRLFNPEKLQNLEVLSFLYTPSFNLIELESKILQFKSLNELANKIAACVRCGKCKTVCPMFFAQGNLFFHSRNKNLNIAMIIEGVLFITQHYRRIDIKFLNYLKSIATHCTLCHKCQKPCPVQLDGSYITHLEKAILADLKILKIPILTNIALKYLTTNSSIVTKIFTSIVLRSCASIQRYIAKIIQKYMKKTTNFRLKISRSLIARPMMPAHKLSLNKFFPVIKDSLIKIPSISKGDNTNCSYNVLYFPGCGSERLFGEIALATIYALTKTNTNVFITPNSLCCGTPFKANALYDTYEKICLKNTIIFNQTKNALLQIKLDAIVVTCGTCYQELQKLEIAKLLDTKILDALAFYKSVSQANFGSNNNLYLYHEPCHDSLQGSCINILAELGFSNIKQVNACCSEAGTLAMTDPKLAAILGERKKENTTSVLIDAQKEHKILRKKQLSLTNCPSCLNGLSKSGISPCMHVMQLIAKSIGGSKWKKQLKYIEDYEIIKL